MDSDDEYIVQHFSDEGGIDSSDDDELVMKEFNKQAKTMGKTSVNDFEHQMAEELEQRVVTHLEKENFVNPCSLTVTKEKETREYFDTDSEEDAEEKDPIAQAQTNMELFYDPQLDLKDEAFVQKRRQAYREKSSGASKKKETSSDAVLNCPACFTTLCHDSQRHEIYKTQYRAMFTFNCKVDVNEVMKIPLRMQKNLSKKSPEFVDESVVESGSSNDTYHPVRCAECNTHVAMLDSDEVYHFFNVITSH